MGYRHTLLEKHEDCPGSAVFMLDGAEGLSEGFLDRGIAVHECIARYISYLQEHGMTSDPEEALRLCRSLTASMDAEVAEDVERCFIDGFSEGYLLEPGVHHPEFRFAFDEEWNPIPAETDYRNAHFSGRVDDVCIRGQKMIVTDWKTDWWAPNTMPATVRRQLRRYAWAAHKTMGGDVREIELRVVYIRRMWTLTDEEIADPRGLEYVRQELTEQIRAVEASIAEPEYRVGGSCATCLYRTLCPKYRTVAPPGAKGKPPMGEEDWQTYAQAYLLLDARVKDMRKLLEARVRTSPVPLSERESLQMVSSESQSVKDPSGFGALLAQSGISPKKIQDAVTFPVMKARALAKEAGLDWKAVFEEYGETKFRNSLKVAQKGGGK
uniref:Putative PD-(D/E)XK nuclease superfamily protein n=1 Tax=viral metagenome TaxID=1070528 RepID=A0A6H1ZE90_9ZZZZ